MTYFEIVKITHQEKDLEKNKMSCATKKKLNASVTICFLFLFFAVSF